ncbi:endonuclease domain-containing protein [Candidatus Peregrinibacteria bacterium]|nr:endonuclease domain-containing protein [Candidatus Peregrinibacteria bacterium]
MKPEEGYILYDTELTKLAKENRKNPTRAEARMWYEVLQGEKTGYKFLRQKPMLNFILDFYCSKLLLAIEVDGGSHAEQEEYDQKRTKLLNSHDIKVIRYWNDEVMDNIGGVWESVAEEIEIRKKELQQFSAHQPPTPPYQEGIIGEK